MTQSTNETADGSKGIVKLTESEHCKLLAAEHRRLALDVLACQSSQTGLMELATELAAHEDNTDGDVDSEIDEDAISHIAAQLHHIHLPLMADLGVVSYDPESHRIGPPRVLVTI